jgi:hypothetical protein
MPIFLFFLQPISAGIAFLFSLLSYTQRPVPLYLRLLSFYLLFDSIVELFADWEAWYRQNNLLLSSLSALASFCFYIYIVRGFVQRPKAKRIFLYFLTVLPPVFAVNIFLVQNSQFFQSITYSLGCLFVVTTCIYYFWELFQHTYYVKLIREPAFWICSGILFYFVCSFPIYSLINLVLAEPEVIKVLAIILDTLNILLYLSFVIAFLCRLKLKKSI